VTNSATPEAFSRYDRQLTVAALRETENFHWCLSPSCNSGQISNDDCNRFTCVTCQAKHCTQHQVVWHKGESCEQYDLRHQRHRRDDQASEAEVRRTSKPCPNCRKVVHKFEGCNHITCESEAPKAQAGTYRPSQTMLTVLLVVAQVSVDMSGATSV
jgi:hypothetical protein